MSNLKNSVNTLWIEKDNFVGCLVHHGANRLPVSYGDTKIFNICRTSTVYFFNILMLFAFFKNTNIFSFQKC